MRLNRFRKLISAEDAARKVRDNDTITVSGFVTQCCPDELLRHLAQRFETKGTPGNLTLLFGGGPGDFAFKGLGRLAERPGMIARAVGSHYGQVPLLAKRVIANEIPGFALPLGAISKMIRSAASNTPFHVSQVGLGTFVDPRVRGGTLNKLAEDGPQLVKLVDFNNVEYLQYQTLPINVALIQATTADLNGNLTLERESILGDTRLQANAAKAAGGVVIAQVSRLALENTLKARDVHIAGSLVDYIVLVPDQPQSFFTGYNAARSGEIRVPPSNADEVEDTAAERLIIARRAALELKLNNIVNLGIGMPEGVAKVCKRENVLQHITLTTEAGVIGGQAAGGKEFGPGENYDALVEMNAQFDFYNGGGLHCAFLGMAQVGKDGNVNVSRLSPSKLTGPGGFMDIVTGTQKIVFMGSFLKKGGLVKTFQQTCGMEVTFNGRNALRNGQNVLYVSERAVFSLNYRGTLKLEEIAPGYDLQRDILDHLDFVPHGLDKVKLMDSRIFDLSKSCGLQASLFSIPRLMETRIEFFQDQQQVLVDFSNLQMPDLESVHEFSLEAAKQCKALLSKLGYSGPLSVVLKTDGAKVPEKLIKPAREFFIQEFDRVLGTPKIVFWRAVEQINATQLPDEAATKILWDDWVGLGKHHLSRTGLREQLERNLHKRIMPVTLDKLMGGADKGAVTFQEFPQLLQRVQQVLFR